MMFMSFGVAKAQKIATVDVAAILNMMPEKIKADEQLKAFSTAKQAELENQRLLSKQMFRNINKKELN